MAYGTLAAEAIQTSTGQIVGASSASTMKNRIINGDMRIDQRYAGTSQAATDGGYYIDRWGTIKNEGVFNVQQNNGSVTPPAGFTNYWGANVTTAATPTGTTGLRYKIEGYNIADLAWGTSSAKTVTISFWAYSSLTGNFSCSLWNTSQTLSYPFLYNIPTANTWTYCTAVIPGPTSGTWNTSNGTGIGIDWSMGTIAGNQGTAGSWNSGFKQGTVGQVQVIATNGATLYLTGVQLEAGATATTFDFRHYGQELALCQRYYYTTSSGSIYMAGQSYGANTVDGLRQSYGWPVTMRADPSASISGGTNGGSAASIAVLTANASNCVINLRSTGGGTSVWWQGGTITASVEL